MKRNRKVICAIVLFLSVLLDGFHVYATDTSCVHQMLIFLQKAQTSGQYGFPIGLFPSYRQYFYHSEVLKDDPNMFFTGLILVTLNEIYPELSEADQKIVQQIRKKALPALALFKNKDGGATYNFWCTNPPEIFPNSGWMNWFDKLQSLPDDFDDTSIGLLASEADTETARKVHVYMQFFTNRRRKRIKNTFKKYRKFPAYSVWFGKKFPVDFDICVLANTLYFVSSYKLTWTKADSASLKLIEQMISTRDYINHPEYVSPHYQRISIILYHLSRLMSGNSNVLLPYKKVLISEAEKELAASNNPVEKMMLETALKRWGVNVSDDHIARKDCGSFVSDLAYGNFVFFIANMASMLPNPLKSIFSKSGLGHFNYYCPAYNVALALEEKLTEVK